MNKEKNLLFINELWDKNITPTLMEYIKIPNKSPQFDKEWQQHGYMDQAVTLISDWCKMHALKNMALEVIKLQNKTPLIFIDIPGQSKDTILLYGHFDKQPEMTGWQDDFHPFKPVLRGDRLYGRGAADDGYAVFASLTAIKSLQQEGHPHARCIILIEGSEESGSPDLPFYIDALKDRIGQPNLIICLDSGCGNYEQLWLTTSLRGLIGGTLTINVLKEGVHSGSASGIVPSCFRILRQLLDRIEDKTNGNIIVNDLHVDVPPNRLQQIDYAAKVLDESLYKNLPFQFGVLPDTTSLPELMLRRTWKPALSITGCDGLPLIQHAGNVTLPSLSFKLSMRLAPTCDVDKAINALKNTLEKDPPYHAHVKFEVQDIGPGWNAPEEQPWLIQSTQKASQKYFGKDAVYMGEGGTIPFMGMLGKKFPKAQFLITGLLGPGSNAHGPNEFLHIPTAKKLTACVAQVIFDQYQEHAS